jgi:uncharacterized membrane protein
MSRHHSKHKQFSSQASNHKRWIFLSIGLAVAVGLLGFAIFANSAADEPRATRVVAENGVVRIPLASIGSNATFFEYNSQNSKKVRFFVVKSSDGVYRAAADACEVCYREKKGYRQQGDDMVCKKCGQHFASNKVNDITGGCTPSAIHRTVDGPSLLIAATDLEAHAVLF